LAALCATHGITFIGPPAHVMQLMGKKTPAKSAMAEAGLTLIPGSDGVLQSAAQAQEVAAATGFPVLLKAESGGGGRGMRIARSAEELEPAFEDARAEAAAAFGDDRVYLEKLVEKGRHVEIQLFADRYGHVVHLGERDCTVQRSHQKLIEESPAPGLDPAERARTLDAAVRATRSIGYVGAGTMEFLLDGEGTLRFMEMNTRLQVEHTVSEMRSGVDLVEEQIRVAAGHANRLRQDNLPLEGHALECRINAEDPSRDFAPAPGRLDVFEVPEGEGVRVDTHAEAGYVVPPFYDSLVAKVIAHGPDRDAAIDRMIGALEAFRVEGVPTTIPMHLAILRSRAFRENTHDTGSIPGWER
jgi:acetyl-CoA carboxylase biotin carboxylase subunit